MGNLELSVFLVIFSCTTVFTANTNTTNPTIHASFSLTNTSTNTASETRNSTTTPKTAPLTSKPSENCANRNLSCGECVQDADCYWCEADDTCKRYPSLTKVIPRDCEGNTWFWKQCVVAGKVLNCKFEISFPGFRKVKVWFEIKKNYWITQLGWNNFVLFCYFFFRLNTNRLWFLEI